MTLKEIVMLTLQVSILCTVFGFGLNATLTDLLAVGRRPALLAKSVLAVFLIAPALTVALVAAFQVQRYVAIVLVALSISPVPPVLPNRQTRAGGDASFGVGLMAFLSLISLIAIPVSLSILEWIFRRRFTMEPIAIARVVLVSAIAPLIAGMVVRAQAPAFADRAQYWMSLGSKLLLTAAVLVVLAGAAPDMWAIVGDGTVLKMAIIVLACLGAGHVLGGPNQDDAVVLALATSCRHPAIALMIASANYPDQQFGPIVLLYLLVSAVAAMPYVKWRQRSAAGAMQAA